MAHLEQPPLIVIPGAFGSRLFDLRDRRELWPGSNARLLFSSYKGLEVDIDPETLLPQTGHVIAYRVFEQGLGRDFYGQVLSTLEGAGGYRRRQPGEPVEPGQRNYYLYLYDWRLDNVTAVAGLHDLISRIRDDYGDPRLKVDVLAHSNGGLLARYYARFGVAESVDVGSAPDTTTPGADAIRRLLLVGTPNLGSIQPVLSHLRGEEMGLRKVPPEIVATMPGAPQLMPHPSIPWLIDAKGRGIDVDLFDIETWRELGWSIFDPQVRARVVRRDGEGARGRHHLAVLEAFLAEQLRRGSAFLSLIASPAANDPPTTYVFGSDCTPTLARVVVEEIGRKRLGRERPEAIRKPVAGVDYAALMYDPGDSVVTRSSLLGRCRPNPQHGCNGITHPAIAHSVFLCEKHQQLTGNPQFQNNLLNVLFRPAAS